MITLLSTSKNHPKQSAQAELVGGAKPYLEKQILVLKNVCHILQGQHQRVRQKLGDFHWVKLIMKDKQIYRKFGHTNLLKIVYEYFVYITGIFSS